MESKNIIYLSLFFLSAVFVSFIFFMVFFEGSITGDAICLSEYSFTKAICNETNYCQDFEVTCSGTELIDLIPLSGAAVQYPDDWQDPRTPEEANITCN